MQCGVLLRFGLTPEVRGVCELLSLDPLHRANEGTMVITVKQGTSDAVDVLKSLSGTADARLIGTVSPRGFAAVTIRRTLVPEQPLDGPLGSPLPRIC